MHAAWSEVLERRLEGFCHYGFLFILIWPPFVFGAVHPWAFAALEIHIALLIIAWMLRAVISRQLPWLGARPVPRIASWCTRLSLLCLLTLLALQLLPVSPTLLYYLSPRRTTSIIFFTPAGRPYRSHSPSIHTPPPWVS